jgi:hypothetical protein
MHGSLTPLLEPDVPCGVAIAIDALGRASPRPVEGWRPIPVDPLPPFIGHNVLS